MMEYDGICMYMYVHVRVFVYTYMHMEDVYIYIHVYIYVRHIFKDIHTMTHTYTETHVFILENTIVMICAHIWIQDYLLP